MIWLLNNEFPYDEETFANAASNENI